MTNETVIAILGELKKCYLGGIVDALDFAIEALKAQETVNPNTIMLGDMVMYYQCPACLATIDKGNKVCPECGRAVKWE